MMHGQQNEKRVSYAYVPSIS